MHSGQIASRSAADGWWLRWLTVGLLAVVVFYLLPERWQSVVFTSLNLSIPVAVFLGVRRWRPARPAGWVTFAVGMGIYGIGNAIWYFFNFFVLNEDSSIVATANVFYAFGYAVAAVGLLASLAGFRLSWRNVVIDSLTVVVGTTVIWWAYLIRPFFTDDSVPFLTQFLNAAYPFGDVLLIGAVATTLVATSRRSFAENMRLVGISGLVVADALYYWSALGNDYQIGTAMDAFWLVSFVVIGSAAVHPSMAAVIGDERESQGRKARYGFFIGAAIVGPAVIAYDALSGRHVPLEAFAVSSVLLFCLVLVRMTGLLREVNEQMEALDSASMGLRHSEERHRSVVNSLNEVVFQTDLSTRWTFLNSAWTELSGYSVEESLGRPAGELVHPDDREEVILYFASLMDGKNEAIRREARGVDKFGNIKRVEFYVRLLRDRNGEVVGTTGALMDVTERRAAEDALREAEKRFRNLVEQIPVVPYVDLVDEASTNQYVSTRITELVGYTPEEWKEQGLWAKVIHPDDLERVMAEHQRSNRDQLAFVAEYRIRHKEGRYVWVRDEAVRVESEDEQSYWQGVFMDVTHRKVLEDQLVHQAFHDPLTGLANRSLFSDRLSHALSRRERQGDAPLAVLFLDLDDFKTVNDSLGHASGDQLLKTVATRLEDALRGSDTAARLGGDEFGILVEDIDGVEAAQRVAERVIQAIDRPFQLDGREITMRSSIGIAIAEGSESTVDELLRNADLAMYMAKRGGENRWALYEPGMHAAALGRLQMKADLDRALDDDRMVIHYQPIVDLASSRIVGCEALVRWNHAIRGLVGPNEFIPVAEETGFINLLGRWVIREACMQLAEWHRKEVGHPHLTVNLSGRQLHDPMLVTDVAQSLAVSGLSPSMLTLEITESALMTDIGASIEMLYSLKDLGVQLAIDDFGTGYSSLSYLQRFPLDVLKIDRSFVSGMEVGDDDAVLAQAVVRLGQTLRLQTIAEGIEMEEQRAALIRAGCTLGQGYLFSRPVDARAMEKLLLGQSDGVLLLP